MTIREGSVADIPIIRSIAHDTWPVSYAGIISPAQIAYMLEMMYSEASLNTQIEEKGHRFLIAEDGARAIGFAGFEIGYRPERARLHKLYALPALHGTGIGRALLEQVEIDVKQAGDRTIELNVNRANPAKDFYQRKGFRIERDEILDIGEGYVMDDHVMVKAL